MGLDTVELLISIEEAFGIEIPDDVAWTLETPAMVIDFIMRQQEAGKTFHCLSMRSFHRLRDALVREGIACREDLQPDTQLESLLPRKQRRELWTRLRETSRLHIPRLIRPQWLVICLMVVINAVALTIAFTTTNADTSTLWVILIVILILGPAANILTRPFAIHLSKEQSRLGDLARYNSIRSAHLILEPGESFSREQVAAIVKAITIEYCDPKRYREDAYFVKDLGLD